MGSAIKFSVAGSTTLNAPVAKLSDTEDGYMSRCGEVMYW